MTRKERVLMAISHKEADGVPVCAWYTPEAEKKLLKYFGIDSSETETYKSAGGPLPLKMEHDLLITWIGPCTGYYAHDTPEYTDEWGIGWKWFKNPSGGSYTEMVHHPLANLKDPAFFDIPDSSEEEGYESSREMIAKYGDEYAIMGGVACTLFELSWYLRSLEKVMEDMLINKDFAHKFFDKLMKWVIVTDVSINNILAFYNAARKYGGYPLNF